MSCIFKFAGNLSRSSWRFWKTSFCRLLQHLCLHTLYIFLFFYILVHFARGTSKRGPIIRQVTWLVGFRSLAFDSSIFHQSKFGINIFVQYTRSLLIMRKTWVILSGLWTESFSKRNRKPVLPPCRVKTARATLLHEPDGLTPAKSALNLSTSKKVLLRKIKALGGHKSRGCD